MGILGVVVILDEVELDVVLGTHLTKALGVGILGTGVPRLACLQPMAWLCERARTAQLHQQGLKTLTRGQAS